MIGDIASIATAVGVLLAALGLFAQVRQRKFALEQLYIQRYWVIDDDQIFARYSGASSAPHRERYLRLCEDEYEVARLGWIGARVWDVWHDGVVTAVDGLRPDTANYKLLNVCLTGTPGHPAAECPALARAGWRRSLSWRLERALS